MERHITIRQNGKIVYVGNNESEAVRAGQTVNGFSGRMYSLYKDGGGLVSLSVIDLEDNNYLLERMTFSEQLFNALFGGLEEKSVST